MGEINNKHHQSADETEYLNEGKGCAIYSLLALVIIVSAVIFGISLLW